MYLDFGQRSFGRTAECRECGFIYAEGEPSDEAAHRKHLEEWLGLHLCLRRLCCTRRLRLRRLRRLLIDDREERHVVDLPAPVQVDLS